MREKNALKTGKGEFLERSREQVLLALHQSFKNLGKKTKGLFHLKPWVRQYPWRSTLLAVGMGIYLEGLKSHPKKEDSLCKKTNEKKQKALHFYKGLPFRGWFFPFLVRSLFKKILIPKIGKTIQSRRLNEKSLNF